METLIYCAHRSEFGADIGRDCAPRSVWGSGLPAWLSAGLVSFFPCESVPGWLGLPCGMTAGSRRQEPQLTGLDSGTTSRRLYSSGQAVCDVNFNQANLVTCSNTSFEFSYQMSTPWLAPALGTVALLPPWIERWWQSCEDR